MLNTLRALDSARSLDIPTQQGKATRAYLGRVARRYFRTVGIIGYAAGKWLCAKDSLLRSILHLK